MEFDIVALTTTIVIAATALIIGFMLMNGMDLASTPSMTTSVLSTTQTTILTGFGNAEVFLAIGLFVMAMIGIVVIFGGILREE